MTHKIGVVSDTHGLLRPEVLERLKGCEVILHGGDIHTPSTLNNLKNTAAVRAVRGNCDKEWAKDLPQTLDMDYYGVKIFMIHNKSQIIRNLDGVDVVIYGHSHKYEEKYVGNQLWLNPGSCGPVRFTQPITFAILEIDENKQIHVEKCEIPQNKTDTEMA
jgi:hypothetical protein